MWIQFDSRQKHTSTPLISNISILRCRQWMSLDRATGKWVTRDPPLRQSSAFKLDDAFRRLDFFQYWQRRDVICSVWEKCSTWWRCGGWAIYAYRVIIKRIIRCTQRDIEVLFAWLVSILPFHAPNAPRLPLRVVNVIKYSISSFQYYVLHMRTAPRLPERAYARTIYLHFEVNDRVIWIHIALKHIHGSIRSKRKKNECDHMIVLCLSFHLKVCEVFFFY